MDAIILHKKQKLVLMENLTPSGENWIIHSGQSETSYGNFLHAKVTYGAQKCLLCAG